MSGAAELWKEGWLVRCAVPCSIRALRLTVTVTVTVSDSEARRLQPAVHLINLGPGRCTSSSSYGMPVIIAEIMIVS
jgi:hypothetical protein